MATRSADGFTLGHIRDYYERHSRAFVAYGQGGDLGAMHRAVWGPGVTTRALAFRYVEDQVAEIVVASSTDAARPHVIDLGCGVGGSLCYLATRLPIVATGITISPSQVRMARERVHTAGLSDRVTLVEADYSALPDSIASADVAFAIESFVHAPDPVAFLTTCRRLVRPGGALAICDDVRRAAADAAGRTAERTIDRFRRGWHVNTLLGRDKIVALAAGAGFDHVSATDLTPFLKIGRPRDRLVDVLAPLVEWWPWRWRRLDPWLGGSALQRALRRGWIGYDLLVFRRAPRAGCSTS
jgi:SAM-dependent methyltransferase